MKAIGGYFGLELNKLNSSFHSKAIHLNTARNAFEYVLRAKNYKKVYIPYYTCDVMLEPIEKLNLQHEFYHVNEQLEPLFEYGKLGGEEAFLYTNYFGLKDTFIAKLAQVCRNVIVDNSQALFADPIAGIDTFYSPRKFVGIPDGAYLYTDQRIGYQLPKDVSHERMAHLLKRLDISAEEGYADFLNNDSTLCNQAIKEMSNLSRALLSSIDFDFISQRRKHNFEILHKSLGSRNKLNFELLDSSVPLVYPYWTEDENLRKRLMEKRIYTASYWPIVDQWAPSGLEHRLKNEIVHLPIDQRYNEEDLKKIITLI